MLIWEISANKSPVQCADSDILSLKESYVSESEDKSSGNISLPGERLKSLDVFRGLTMFLLIGEGTRFFSAMSDPAFEGSLIAVIGEQFHHHPWNGLRFWDLVQPFFMFIVGVALPFAVANRRMRGASYGAVARHAVTRSLVLLLLGWGLYCIGPGKIVFRFQNVLAQLSVAYLIAFILMNRNWRIQLGCSFGLLALTEILYRSFSVAGYDQPFTPDANFGAYVDMLIGGELSGGHWVSFNAIPTAAHTIWGVLAGQVLMRTDRPARWKIGVLCAAGVLALAVGYGLDPVTPIIKRIATTSFVIVSGGWCLLALALCYWIVDVLKFRRGAIVFTIVGMNSLFIYLFAEVGGSGLVYRIVKPFSFALASWAGEPQAKLLTGVIVWATLWYLCYWLWRRRIFIKI